MKKLFFIIMSFAIFSSCSTSSDNANKDKNENNVETPVIPESEKFLNDKDIKSEIISHAKKCNWRIEVKNKEFYETYSGEKILIDSINIVAKSINENDGSVKFSLWGTKIGKPDMGSWYGMFNNVGLKYMTNSFVFEDEWVFKKYDSGWLINEETEKQKAIFY